MLQKVISLFHNEMVKAIVFIGMNSTEIGMYFFCTKHQAGCLDIL